MDRQCNQIVSVELLYGCSTYVCDAAVNQRSVSVVLNRMISSHYVFSFFDKSILPTLAFMIITFIMHGADSFGPCGKTFLVNLPFTMATTMEAAKKVLVCRSTQHPASFFRFKNPSSLVFGNSSRSVDEIVVFALVSLKKSALSPTSLSSTLN